MLISNIATGYKSDIFKINGSWNSENQVARYLGNDKWTTVMRSQEAISHLVNEGQEKRKEVLSHLISADGVKAPRTPQGSKFGGFLQNK